MSCRGKYGAKGVLDAACACQGPKCSANGKLGIVEDGYSRSCGAWTTSFGRETGRRFASVRDGEVRRSRWGGEGGGEGDAMPCLQTCCVQRAVSRSARQAESGGGPISGRSQAGGSVAKHWGLGGGKWSLLRGAWVSLLPPAGSWRGNEYGQGSTLGAITAGMSRSGSGSRSIAATCSRGAQRCLVGVSIARDSPEVV